MKTTVVSCLLLCLLVQLNASAQKVDLDRHTFKYAFRNLPHKPLNPAYRTYTTSVACDEQTSRFFGEGEIEKMISIGGWRKLEGKSAHVKIDIDISSLHFAPPKILEREEIRKDKKGVETKTYYYRVKTSYSFSVTADATDFKDSVLAKWTFADREYDYLGEEATSQSQAAEDFEARRGSIRKNLARDHVASALSTVTENLSRNFGFGPMTTAFGLWILDSKKHPEYQLQQDNWRLLKRTMELVTVDELPVETRETLLKVAEYFDSIPTKYAKDEKADRKLRYGAYFNRAVIFNILLDLDRVRQEAEKLIQNDYDAKDGKHFKEDADAVAQLLKKNNINSRNFPVDVSKFQPPAKENK